MDPKSTDSKLLSRKEFFVLTVTLVGAAALEASCSSSGTDGTGTGGSGATGTGGTGTRGTTGGMVQFESTSNRSHTHTHTYQISCNPA